MSQRMVSWGFRSPKASNLQGLPVLFCSDNRQPQRTSLWSEIVSERVLKRIGILLSPEAQRVCSQLFPVSIFLHLLFPLPGTHSSSHLRKHLFFLEGFQNLKPGHTPTSPTSQLSSFLPAPSSRSVFANSVSYTVSILTESQVEHRISRPGAR